MNEPEHNQLVAESADNLRTFIHQTRTEQLPDRCITPPDAYSILGSAAELADAMPQALAQLGDALRRSLTLFDVYDRDRQPADSIAIATQALSAAADAFGAAAQHLSDAQAAIAYQGVNEDSAGNLRLAPGTACGPRIVQRAAADQVPGASAALPSVQSCAMLRGRARSRTSAGATPGRHRAGGHRRAMPALRG
jgi:hypothetical protein